MAETSSRRRGADLRDLSLLRTVDAIKPKRARYFVWDAAMPGFGIDVRPTGSRSWVIFYRVLGIKRRMKLGTVDRMPHDEARRKARAALSAVDDERDPLLERNVREDQALAAEKARRTAATFSTVAAEYVTTLEHKKSPRWAKEARRILDTDILKRIGAVPIGELSVRHVTALHEGMSDRPFLANRAKAIVSAVAARAIREGIRSRAAGNPAVEVENYAEPPRTRELSASEWRRFSKAIAKVAADVADLPPWDTQRDQLRAIEFLALSGARLGAALPRRAGDVDLERGILKVSPVHKYVARVVLGSAARRLVAELVAPDGDPRAFLFPGQTRRTGARTARGRRDKRPERAAAPIAGVAQVWRRLCTAAEIEDFRVHDLRGLYAQLGAELNHSSYIVGGILGHSAKGVTEKHYLTRPDALLVSAADAISEKVAERLGIAPAAAPAGVLPIARKRRKS